jgi:YegS/Rv2252/BmrU family lipid kinase
VRKALLLVNPIAGRAGHGLARARCIEAMTAQGLAVEVLETGGPGQVARLVAGYQGADFDMLVAAGGDGTIREVAEAASWLDVPVGIIPLGTSNSVARELGIPTRPLEAARVAATGAARAVDMAETSGRRFLMCLGVGFDAEVVARVHASRRGGIHMASYVPHATQALFSYAFPPIEVVVDGVAAPPGPVQVVVANTRMWGGPMVLSREARIDDGWLDVCLFYGGRWSLTAQALRALLGQPLARRRERFSGRGALVLRAREVFIPGPPSAPVEMDGDPGPPLPLAIQVLPKAVQIVVPKEKLPDGAPEG